MAKTNGSNGCDANYVQWKTITEDFETLAVTNSSDPSQFSSRCVVPPIVTSSMFLMDTPTTKSTPYLSEHEKKLATPTRADNTKIYEYSRFANPTREIAENVFAKLEGSKYAMLFGSGTAAVACVVYLLKSGDHLLYTEPCYHGSTNIYEESSQFGISCDAVTATDVEAFIKLIRPNTKLIMLETPANPTLAIIDIAELVRRVRQVKSDIIIAVDNTFMTPILQRPLDLGADIAVYSCSKYLGGHGDIIMGAITTNSDAIHRKNLENLLRLGSIPSAFDCYLLNRSLKTLPLRMKQHSKTAYTVAKYLESHPQVEKVLYPGLKSHPDHEIALRQQHSGGGMVGFYIKGGFEAATTFLTSIKVILMAPSLGADTSLASIPGRMSHNGLPAELKEKFEITDNLIRLSVGLESVSAIINDLEQAIAATVKNA